MWLFGRRLLQVRVQSVQLVFDPLTFFVIPRGRLHRPAARTVRPPRGRGLRPTVRRGCSASAPWGRRLKRSSRQGRARKRPAADQIHRDGRNPLTHVVSDAGHEEVKHHVRPEARGVPFGHRNEGAPKSPLPAAWPRTFAVVSNCRAPPIRPEFRLRPRPRRTRDTAWSRSHRAPTSIGRRTTKAGLPVSPAAPPSARRGSPPGSARPAPSARRKIVAQTAVGRLLARSPDGSSVTTRCDGAAPGPAFGTRGFYLPGRARPCAGPSPLGRSCPTRCRRWLAQTSAASSGGTKPPSTSPTTARNMLSFSCRSCKMYSSIVSLVAML